MFKHAWYTYSHALSNTFILSYETIGWGFIHSQESNIKRFWWLDSNLKHVDILSQDLTYLSAWLVLSYPYCSHIKICKLAQLVKVSGTTSKSPWLTWATRTDEWFAFGWLRTWEYKGVIKLRCQVTIPGKNKGRHPRTSPRKCQIHVWPSRPWPKDYVLGVPFWPRGRSFFYLKYKI